MKKVQNVELGLLYSWDFCTNVVFFPSSFVKLCLLGAFWFQWQLHNLLN